MAKIPTTSSTEPTVIPAAVSIKRRFSVPPAASTANSSMSPTRPTVPLAWTASPPSTVSVMPPAMLSLVSTAPPEIRLRFCSRVVKGLAGVPKLAIKVNFPVAVLMSEFRPISIVLARTAVPLRAVAERNTVSYPAFKKLV